MICALCLQDATLCDSHIIPEFLYRTLYDAKHRFHQISADPDRPNRILQKGLREPLLCESCEQRFSVSERYACMFLNGGVGMTVRQNGNRLDLSNLDYKKLKLFQLSILWRAGVASLPVFSEVRLGPHAERIRRMLLSDDPGPTDAYGCIMFTLMHEREVLPDLIAAPSPSKLEKLRAYRFVFGGLVFVYVVSGMRPPGYVIEHFLQDSGTAIVKMQQAKELGFLADSASTMHRHGKLA